ncbi:MAG: adenylate/guanylate cyclase domain-containing protein [Actinomycetota bacterium]
MTDSGWGIMQCGSCRADNPDGHKFCSNCGAPLARTCPNCSSAVLAGAKFCGECGFALAGIPAAAPVGNGELAGREPPTSERRLVSVLFADLVGFTTLSESRDAEEVRELLSRYFDTCRQLIARYGGTVEKFIGDAVMAVWGTPVAREDDAERAVRAGLELTAAVSALGSEIGAPDLRARAGINTGEASVTIGTSTEGMVAGDMVNTASRIQSAASPGQVFVNEGTRRATEAAIAYDDVGSFELKGKAEPLSLWRAVRVTAGRRGAQKSTALEAPFVGRDRQLRMVKDLFHASADEHAAHAISIIGIAGIGKSRLAWEFEKYIDGLLDTINWHRGRCLAYGEGVTYWALAEMVRMRARIVEEEEAASAIEKLRAVVASTLPDPEERRWVEPRLAHLLGLEERVAPDRADLFSACRLFFERLSDIHPTVLVFEDLQWADPSLVEFIEYLLEWSRAHPLFVITLARPEVADRYPNWSANKRNFTSLFLDPLDAPAMEEMLEGLVPGLPEETRAKILARAEGVPLYAVETVRMLIDRGLLVPEGDRYKPAGAVESLEVPETLQALIAARLDGLTSDERSLLQDASVLGKTFTRAGLAALTGRPESELEPLLGSLMRKEFLTVQADPRSPERGQYGFLQDLVKRVAHDMLSKKERKARHLAAAEALRLTWGEEEGDVVEVVASHYVEAYEAAPDAPDADEIKARAAEMLARAGEHAASLAANEEAWRYFEQAIRLTDDLRRAAALHVRAGDTAWMSEHREEARVHLETAKSSFESLGLPKETALALAALSKVLATEGHIEATLEMMEKAFEVLSKQDQDEALGELAAEISRVAWWTGRTELAAERAELAMSIGEKQLVPHLVANALLTKSVMLLTRGHNEEATALLKHAASVAQENDLPMLLARAYNNLSMRMGQRDRYEEGVAYGRDGVNVAHRIGDRWMENWNLGSAMQSLLQSGRWDEALRDAERIGPVRVDWAEAMMVIDIHLARGELEQAMAKLEGTPESELIEDVQTRALLSVERGGVYAAKGEWGKALQAGREAMKERAFLGSGFMQVKFGFALAMQAATALGDIEALEEILDEIGAMAPGEMTPFLSAQAARFTAHRMRLKNEGAPEGRFKEATGLLREIGAPFWLAVVLTEHAEYLAGAGRAHDAEPLASEARGIFEQLRAQPWLDRVAAIGNLAAASSV